jgi:hypothetical protein
MNSRSGVPTLRDAADGREVALVEWANYAAYRTVQRLQNSLARQPDFSVPLGDVKHEVAECLSDAGPAIEEFDSTDPGFPSSDSTERGASVTSTR